MMLSSRIDHLVLACADWRRRDALRARSASRCSPAAAPADGHAQCLLKLGPCTYLELIAIDPRARRSAALVRLDTPAVRARMANGPFLLTWVAACSDVAAAAALDPVSAR